MADHRAAGPRIGRRAFLGALAAGALAVDSVRQAPRALAASGGGATMAFAPLSRAAPIAPARPPLTLVAARAYHGLLARLDPDAGYRPRFTLNLDAAQPALLHDADWDGVDLAGRSIDALFRLRRLLDVVDAGEAEERLHAYFLGRQGADGLFANEATADAGEVVDSFCQSRALLGLVTWYASSGAAAIGDALERLVAGLDAIAAPQDDGSYFPGVRYQGRWLDRELTAAGAADGRARYGYGALCAQGLLELYALAGHRPALDLAGRLLRHFVEQAGLVSAEGHFVGETHADGYLPLATAAVRYGTAVGDERYVAWAERLYRWVRANSSGFGWVPGPLGLDAAYFATSYGTPARRTCETCSLADAIELALTLARHGYPAYWDDVERFARNQLVENQFGSAEATLGPEGAAAADPPLLAALAGAWESFALPYRLLGRPDGRRLVEGCCSGSGARALSLVWEHSIEARDGTLAVHLGLTHDTPWARVASHEPRDGRLDVHLREPLAVRLRVPDWMPPAQATLWVDGTRRDLAWDGRYVVLDTLPAGSAVSLRCPLATREEAFAVNDQTTLAYWHGNTVVDVLPVEGPAAIYRHADDTLGRAPTDAAEPSLPAGAPAT